MSGTVILVNGEVMIRGLLVSYLESMAPDITIREGNFQSLTINFEVPAGAVMVFVDAGHGFQDVVSEIRETAQLFPALSLAVLSDFASPEVIPKLLELGVKGFLSTSLSAITLAHNLRVLIAGGSVMSPMQWKGSQPTSTSYYSMHPVLQSFSASEWKVLGLLQRAKPNKVIAAEMDVDESFVKNHIRSLMRKTGTRNRVELALVGLACTTSTSHSATAQKAEGVALSYGGHELGNELTDA